MCTYQRQKEVSLMIKVFLVFYWVLVMSQRVIDYLILRQRKLLLVKMLYLKKRKVGIGVQLIKSK